MSKRAKEEGLEYIEELVFENGAVYRGKINMTYQFLNILYRLYEEWLETWTRYLSMARWSKI